MNDIDQCDLHPQDNFKPVFKYFKKTCKHDFTSIINFDESLKNNINVMQLNLPEVSPHLTQSICGKYGMNPLQKWHAYALKSHPGLRIIRNAFTDLGCLVWIHKCLKQYSSSPPYCNNISNLSSSSLDGSTWWSNVRLNLLKGDVKNSLANDLRWATLGYHHNWDTKVYDESNKSTFPSDLDELCRFVLTSIGYTESDSFRSEAAIVNYYPPGSSLGPHVDHSEYCKVAPLLSFSFGMSCIFLIGGKDKSVHPTSMVLHHGDIMIMTEESRLSYHAVPKMLCLDEIEGFLSRKIDDGRMLTTTNHLLRFVNTVHSFRSFVERLGGNDVVEMEKHLTEEFLDESSSEFLSYLKRNVELRSYFFSDDLNCDDLKAILVYIKEHRININARQVNCYHS